jgi:type II secretory pathway component PulC
MRFILCIAIFMVGFFINTFELRAEEKDPFVSIVDLEEESAVRQRLDLANVVLKGIIWSSSRSVAIINEELVMAGDDWAGYKVERIDKDSVSLSDGEKSYQLFLPEDEEVSAKETKKIVAATQEPLPQEMLNPPPNTMPYYQGGTPMQRDMQRSKDER